MTHVGEKLALCAARLFCGMLCPAAFPDFQLQRFIGVSKICGARQDPRLQLILAIRKLAALSASLLNIEAMLIKSPASMQAHCRAVST
jgi:hypothetical protein